MRLILNKVYQRTAGKSRKYFPSPLSRQPFIEFDGEWRIPGDRVEWMGSDGAPDGPRLYYMDPVLYRVTSGPKMPPENLRSDEPLTPTPPKYLMRIFRFMS